MADERGLDLVEISATATPPVCKIIDYSKFKYGQKKKEKENKGKAQRTVTKEIRFGPNTDEHDFAFKVRHAIEFLKSGAQIKAYVRFAGRTIVFKERGEHLLMRFAQALEEHGKVEQMPKLEGKRMHLAFSPIKISKPKKGKSLSAEENTKNKKAEAGEEESSTPSQALSSSGGEVEATKET